jgi:mono/diheme cytochrome c family protein
MKRLVVLAAIVLVVIFTAYGVITLYDYHLKFGRMWETPAVKPYEKPIPLMEAGVVPFAGGEAIFRTAPVEDLKSPFLLTDANTIAAGKQKYFTYCAQCHGKYLDGNGTVGQSFAPLPSDLRSPRVVALSEGALFKEISYGFAKGRQPPLATTIDIPDRWRIIAYLKSLGPRS